MYGNVLSSNIVGREQWVTHWQFKYVKHYTLKADSHIACRAHAVPLPCRAAKGLEYVFPI